MSRGLLLFILLSLFVVPLFAQQNIRSAAAPVNATNPGISRSYHAGTNEAPRALEFVEGVVTSSYFITNIKSYLGIPDDFSFRETEFSIDNIGMQHRVLQQYYKGVLIEGMTYRVHERNGFLVSANGKAMRNIKLNTETTISEEQAFRFAVTHLQTNDSVFRSGKKLIVSKGFTFEPKSFFVAYQFEIAVTLVEDWRVAIDARTGELINKISLVNSCFGEPEPPSKNSGTKSEETAGLLPYVTGTGLTNYYGYQDIPVEQIGTTSRLIGQTENGGTIATYSFGNAPIIMLTLFFEFSKAYEIKSSGNTYYNHRDKPGVSAHWAAAQAFEYFFKTHNRNSFDNNGAPIKSYVHVDVDLDNAFWLSRPKLLGFGDGSNNNPLVELDVVSHELTHGVTHHEGVLNYQNEPGALNESFSDIFSKAVEFQVFGDTATWQLARHFRYGGLRDMSSPNLKGQPDTYMGDLWHSGYDDYGGVHTNSGVQNFWFYLLSEGGSGVNDVEYEYSVKAVGIDKASQITYRNLTEYVSLFSDYFDSRIGSLLATADLFGKNSEIYNEVAGAWDAVGVIDEPTITSFELYDITGTTVKVKGSMIPRADIATYHFEYGTTPSLGSTTPIFSYDGQIEGKITGLQGETMYYVRLVATNENGSSYVDREFTTISLAPMVSIKQTVDVTETTASVYGKVNPNGLSSTFCFEYGLTPELGLVTSSFSLTDTTEFLDVAGMLDNLEPRHTYYYRLKATNSFASTSTETATFFSAVKPLITSVAPLAAQVGTTVTISGQNFSPVAGDNQVSFGAVRANIVSASRSEIRVEVPAGASFGTVSILDKESGLIAESPHEFVPTFANDGKKHAFHLRAGVTDINVYKAFAEDIDGDNKPDIIASHYEGFTVFQNVNNGTDITDESFVRNIYPVPEFSSIEFHIADMDGNGLKDVMLWYRNNLRIYPNYSVPGFIFFGVPIDIPVGSFGKVVLSDFDSDGHIDIAGVSYRGINGHVLTTIRNQNPKGLFSADNFEIQSEIPLPYYSYSLTTGDLNDDGTVDLLVSATDQTFTSVYENISEPGKFKFKAVNISDPTRNRFVRYIANDLNHDGWREVISFSSESYGNLALHENAASSEVSLHPPIISLQGNVQSDARAGDLDGDGNVDLLVGLNNRRFIKLRNEMQQIETIAQSSFKNQQEFGMGLLPSQSGTVDAQITINDLNGDGKPEVINVYNYNFGPHDGYEMEIWQHAENDCPDPSLTTLDVSQKTATIILPPNTNVDQYEIEYKYNGNSDWRTVYSTTMTYLSPGETYQLRIRSKCYLAHSDYHYITFTTECVDLNSFTVTSVQATSVTVYANNLQQIEVQYSPAGEDTWITLSQFTTSFTGLTPGTTYDLRYKGKCASSNEFVYVEFTTLCPGMTSLQITSIEYNRATAQWSGSIHPMDVRIEYSTDGETWAEADEAGLMSPLIPGTRYEVRGQTICTDVLSEFISTSFTTPCPRVADLNVDAVTPFEAVISWSDESNTGRYTVMYSSVINNEVTTLNIASNSLTLEELKPGTSYNVKVAPHCAGDEDFISITFITECYTPVNLSASDITQTFALLSWEDQYGGLPFYVDYSIQGSNKWQTMQTHSTVLPMAELRPGTRYDVKVYIACPSSDEHSTLRFETLLYEEVAFIPNPTVGKIVILPKRNLIGNQFTLHDHAGRQLAIGTLTSYEFDLTEFAAGIYILRVQGESPVKIVKQ